MLDFGSYWFLIPAPYSDSCYYLGSLLVGQDLRVDSVELQDEFVHQVGVQPPVGLEEPAVQL